jgi:transposase-like protein
MNKGKVWRHPETFHRMAIERFKCCENIKHLAKELGVARQTLYRWHKKSECAEEGEDQYWRNPVSRGFEEKFVI